MTNTTNFSVRMDSELKKQYEALYGEPGTAILEAEQLAHDPTVKRYDDVEEALQELKSEIYKKDCGDKLSAVHVIS